MIKLTEFKCESKYRFKLITASKAKSHKFGSYLWMAFSTLIERFKNRLLFFRWLDEASAILVEKRKKTNNFHYNTLVDIVKGNYIDKVFR